MFKILRLVALACVLAACGVPKPRLAPVPGAEVPSAIAHGPHGVAYHIDTSQSELRLLVYRSGAMARLGHNHVIVNRGLTGSADVTGAASTSSFSLTVPVDGFVVDETPVREEEGADFPGEIPADAKSGTLHNLLSPALLDADEFPAITVASAAIDGAEDALTATLSVSVAGHPSTITAPLTLQRSAGRIAATGTFELRQTALGLTPFSVLLGAIQVRDEMLVKFRIVVIEG